MKTKNLVNQYNFNRFVLEFKQNFGKIGSAVALGFVLITSGCEIGSPTVSPKATTETTSTENPTLAPTPTPIPTPTPTAEPTVSTTPSPSPTPSRTEEPIGLCDLIDGNPLMQETVRGVHVLSLKINGKPYKLFVTTDGMDPATGDNCWADIFTRRSVFSEPRNSSDNKDIKMEDWMKKRFNVKSYEILEYLPLSMYLSEHNISVSFDPSTIKTIGDFKPFYANESIVPKEERLIIPWDDLVAEIDYNQMAAHLSNELDRYRETMGIKETHKSDRFVKELVI